MTSTTKTKKTTGHMVATKQTVKRPAAGSAAKSTRNARATMPTKPQTSKRRVAAATKGAASRATRANALPPSTESYKHDDKAVQRQDIGVQHRFAARKPPKTYRYDSSLDPALSWDENASRHLGDWLIGLIERVATEGEATAFAQPQEWQSGRYKVESLKLEDSVWDHLAGTVSEPFSGSAHKLIAVKVIDERGNELMVVKELS